MKVPVYHGSNHPRERTGPKRGLDKAVKALKSHFQEVGKSSHGRTHIQTDRADRGKGVVCFSSNRTLYRRVTIVRQLKYKSVSDISYNSAKYHSNVTYYNQFEHRVQILQMKQIAWEDCPQSTHFESTLSPPSTCGKTPPRSPSPWPGKTHRFYSCMQQCPLVPSAAICAAGKESPIQFNM